MSNFNDYLNKLMNTVGFYAAEAKTDFADEVIRLMTANNINQKELAKRVGVSPAYVSNVLGGDMNLSIDSMAKFTFALGARIEISTKPIAVHKATVIDVTSSKAVCPPSGYFYQNFSQKSANREIKSIIFEKTGDRCDGDAVSTLAA